MITALVGGLAALVSATVALRQHGHARELASQKNELEEKLAQRNSDLAKEREEHSKRFERTLNAQDVLTKYSAPLASAAYDLQSRCWNIVEKDFFTKFGRDHDRFEDAQITTLFRFAQYFGWTEILRREVQFLSFPDQDETEGVSKLMSDLSRAIASSEENELLMIWADEQRAIGEHMIVESAGGSPRCMGYATFRAAYLTTFAPLFARVVNDLDEATGKQRLRAVQKHSCELVAALDKDVARYEGQPMALAQESVVAVAVGGSPTND